MTLEFGRSPIHYAALENDGSEIERLLFEGADPNATDHDGRTPLHFAAQQNALVAVTLLLDSGARVDPLNKFGNSPLMEAVFSDIGGGEIIGLLRSRGADPALANHAGQTPVGLSRLIANYPVAQFFADLP